MAVGAELGQSFLDGSAGGGWCGIGVLSPGGRKGSSCRRGCVLKALCCSLGEVYRRGVNHEIGDGALPVPLGIGIGGFGAVERVESVGVWRAR